MEPQRISVGEAKRRIEAGERVAFVDARSNEAWQKAAVQIPKSIRVPPDSVEAHLAEIPRDALIVPYCT
jgi:hypothetical protein